jgi:hypothetical protein
MDGAIIECKANNTVVSQPTVRSLALDMHRKDIWIYGHSGPKMSQKVAFNN